MKILFLNYESPPLGGGASSVSYEIARHYVLNGNEVHVVTMAYKSLPINETTDGINIYRVKCIRSKKEVCHPWEQLSFIINAKSVLKKLCNNNRYDICHTHFLIPTGLLSVWIKNKYNIAYIVSAHGSDVPGYNKNRFRFMHLFTKPTLKKVCHKAKAITVPSKSLKDLLLENVSNKLKSKVYIIPNGSRTFFKKNIPKSNIIFSSGRMVKGKGFHLLIKAFQEIQEEFYDWSLVIAGDGIYYNEVKNNIKEEDNIQLVGWLDNNSERYIELINKAKIFSLLSQYESQGIVIIEAMSASCALFTSDISVLRENVTENIGLTVDRNNHQEIVKKLKWLLESKKLFDMQKASREKFLSSYQWKKIIYKYIELVEKIGK